MLIWKLGLFSKPIILETLKLKIINLEEIIWWNHIRFWNWTDIEMNWNWEPYFTKYLIWELSNLYKIDLYKYEVDLKIVDLERYSICKEKPYIIEVYISVIWYTIDLESIRFENEILFIMDFI